MHVLQTPIVLLPEYSCILENRTWPVKQHHNHQNKMETSLYHLVVWGIQGERLTTTQLSSGKLLILRRDRKLNLHKSTCIYKVSTKCHRNGYFMKNYKCYFFHSFIHSFFHHIHHDVWLTDTFSGKSHYISTVNHILGTKTNRANPGRFTRRYCNVCFLNARSSERADSL